MILDCSSYESVKRSVSEIFSVNGDTLVEMLRAIDKSEALKGCPEDIVFAKVCDAFGVPATDFRILWFHGSRVEEPNSFNEIGIVPKSQAREFLEERLQTLSSDLEFTGSNPFSGSLSGKQALGEKDEGPFAVLFKDVAIEAPGANGSYHNAPELVEDIAGTLLGSNYDLLVKRYQEISHPCIVSFLDTETDGELACALWYLCLVEHGELHIEAADIANTCFNAGGLTIAPDSIQAVEVLENS